MEYRSKDREIHGESNVWSTAQRTERSMVRAMCGVPLKDRKRDNDLMLMLGLNKPTDLLAIASSMHLYCNVLRRGDSHVLSRATEFEVES